MGFPLLVEGIGRALLLFIRTHPVEAAHEDIAKYQAIYTAHGKARGDLEAGILLQAAQIYGNHGDLGMPRLLQGTADKADIVAGAAAASRLGNQYGCLVQIVSAGLDGLHDLPHHNQGGVAGVVVYVFQSHVHGFPVVRLSKHLQMIAGGVEGRCDQAEMDRRHLGTEDGVILPHFLCEYDPCDVCRGDIPLDVLFLPHTDGRDQGTDTDAGGP